jgi:hypothetical protein
MPTKFVSCSTEDSSREYEALHYEVGKALSVWMAVEVQAQQSFAIALNVSGASAARAVFRAAINANARLAMADEAIAHRLNLIGEVELLARWTKLYDRAKKLAKRRNAVAHGQAIVIQGMPDSNGISYAVGARVVDPLIPTGTDYKPTRLMAEGISISQLQEMQNKFHELAYDIYVHGQDLRAAMMRRAKSQ